MLKFKLDTLDGLDENLKPFYKEVDVAGKKVFVLQVDGAVASDRLTELQRKNTEFRNTNTSQLQLLKVFAGAAGIEVEEGLTAAEVTSLLESKKEDAQEALKKAGKASSEEIDKLVNQKLEAFKTASEAEKKRLSTDLTKLAAEKAKLAEDLEKVMIENAVVEAGSKRGLKPTAHFDIVTRARRVFKYAGGKVRALEDDGETAKIGPDGSSELTISDWVEAQASADAPHLFESSHGGGAAGGSGGAGQRNGAGGNGNPWNPKTLNLTRQMQLMKSDPVAARRLAKEFGVELPALAPAR